MTLVRDLVALTPSYLVPGIVSLVSVPLLFHLLGAGDYGVWALAYGISNGVPQLSTSWLEALILRFGHLPRRRSRAPLVAVATVGSAGGGALLAAVFIPGAELRVAAATGLLTLGTAAYTIVIAQLQAQLRFGVVSRVASVRSVIGAVLGVGGAAATGDVVVAILGLAGGFGVGALDGFLAARTAAGNVSAAPAAQAAGHQTPDTVAQEVRYGAASGAFAIAQFVLAVGDRFILAAVRPLEDVGVYAATYAIVDLVFRFGPSIAVTSLRQRFFRAWDSGNRERAAAVFVAGLTAMAWLIGGAVIGITLLGPAIPFLPLDAALVGPIAAGLGGFVVGNLLVVPYSAELRQTRVAANVILATVINIALNLALTPTMGALGAALATAVSYAAYLIFNVSGQLTLIRMAGWRPLLVVACFLLVGAAATVLPAFGPAALYVAAGTLALTTPIIVGLLRQAIQARPD